MKATCRVVTSELQADPERNQPWSPCWIAEGGAEVFQGRRVVAADAVHEAADQDDAVDRRGQDQPGQHDGEARDAQAAGSAAGIPASPLPETDT